MSKITISAKITEMAAETVKSHIGNDRYNLIKSKDNHPFFFALIAGSEGISTGTIQGLGSQKKYWSKKKIQELTNHLNSAVLAQVPQVFIRHKKFESEVRNSHGFVISGFPEETQGKSQAVAVGYILPEKSKTRQKIKDGELDVGSIEADCELSKKDDIWEVEKIEKLEAIALANSQWATPGFSDAKIVAAIQELENSVEMQSLMSPQTNINQKEKKKMPPEKITLSEVKVMISDNGWRPESLYSKEDILGCGFVKETIKDEVQKKQDDIEKTIKEKDKTIKNLESELLPHRQKSAIEKSRESVKAHQLLKNVEKEKVAFITDRINSPVADEDLEKLIKSELEFIAKHNIAFGKNDPNKPEIKIPAAQVPFDILNMNDAEAAKSLENPEKNDFIPK